MDLAQRLTQLRTLHAMSQQDVADAVHISRQAVSKWETGRAVPDTALLIALADLYRVSLDELVGRDSTAPAVETPAIDQVYGPDAAFDARPPVTPKTSPRPRIALMVILAVVGTLIGVAIIVVGAVYSATSFTQPMTASTNGQPVTTKLASGLEQGIWVERGMLATCSVIDPTGASVPQTSHAPGATVVDNYSLAWSFTTPTDGTYTIACQSPSGMTVLRIAPPVKAGLMAASIIVGVLLILASWIAVPVAFGRRGLGWSRSLHCNRTIRFNARI